MIPPQIIMRAAQLLQGKIRPDDISTINRFIQLAKHNKAKGNLGVLGQDIQSLSKDVFGRAYGGYQNTAIANALNQVMQKLGINR